MTQVVKWVSLHWHKLVSATPRRAPDAKILWLFLNDSITQRTKPSWNSVQSLLEEDCSSHSGFFWIVVHVTNSITHYQKKESGVEVKFNHCLRHIRNIRSHAECELETCAWGGVWTFNHRPGWTARCILQVSWTWVACLCFYDSLMIPNKAKTRTGELNWCVVDFTYFLTVSWWACRDPASAVKYWWRDT